MRAFLLPSNLARGRLVRPVPTVGGGGGGNGLRNTIEPIYDPALHSLRYAEYFNYANDTAFKSVESGGSGGPLYNLNGGSGHLDTSELSPGNTSGKSFRVDLLTEPNGLSGNDANVQVAGGCDPYITYADGSMVVQYWAKWAINYHQKPYPGTPSAANKEFLVLRPGLGSNKRITIHHSEEQMVMTNGDGYVLNPLDGTDGQGQWSVLGMDGMGWGVGCGSYPNDAFPWNGRWACGVKAAKGFATDSPTIRDNLWHFLTWRIHPESATGAGDGCVTQWVDHTLVEHWDGRYDNTGNLARSVYQRMFTGAADFGGVEYPTILNKGAPHDQSRWYDVVRVFACPAALTEV